MGKKLKVLEKKIENKKKKIVALSVLFTKNNIRGINKRKSNKLTSQKIIQSAKKEQFF